jgi:hypothetical protein
MKSKEKKTRGERERVETGSQLNESVKSDTGKQKIDPI